MQTEYMKQRMQHILQGRPLHKKAAKSIPQVSEKRKEKLKEDKKLEDGLHAHKKSLNVFFKEIQENRWINGNPCPCENCGEMIPVTFARHATAHLLPKKIFKSIATHPLNYMILGANCGCHDKTHVLEQIVKMKVWPEIAKRLKELIALLPHDELKHVSTELYEAIQNAD
ncbi:MAG: hypothetical protein J7527_08820 [Chitinophagaceae bacterium]|nr:hypothetical protein [Chitinophagaceae bacterium]